MIISPGWRLALERFLRKVSVMFFHFWLGEEKSWLGNSGTDEDMVIDLKRREKEEKMT